MSEDNSNLKGLGISFIIIVLAMVGISFGVTFVSNLGFDYFSSKVKLTLVGFVIKGP